MLEYTWVALKGPEVGKLRLTQILFILRNYRRASWSIIILHMWVALCNSDAVLQLAIANYNLLGYSCYSLYL